MSFRRKDGARPALFHISCCVVRLLFVLFYVLFVCKCVLPPGDNPTAVNKYIVSYICEENIYNPKFGYSLRKQQCLFCSIVSYVYKTHKASCTVTTLNKAITTNISTGYRQFTCYLRELYKTIPGSHKYNLKNSEVTAKFCASEE
jgi:hypothetical protein